MPQLISLLEQVRHLSVVSLDNDLGQGKLEGYDFIKLMVEHNLNQPHDWKIDTFLIHSANPVAANNTRALIKNAQQAGIF